MMTGPLIFTVSSNFFHAFSKSTNTVDIPNVYGSYLEAYRSLPKDAIFTGYAAPSIVAKKLIKSGKTFTGFPLANFTRPAPKWAIEKKIFTEDILYQIQVHRL